MTALSRKHAHFKGWAEEQGVKITGLSVASLPGKGIGVVASRKLKVINDRAAFLASTLQFSF